MLYRLYIDNRFEMKEKKYLAYIYFVTRYYKNDLVQDQSDFDIRFDKVAAHYIVISAAKLE